MIFKTHLSDLITISIQYYMWPLIMVNQCFSLFRMFLFGNSNTYILMVKKKKTLVNEIKLNAVKKVKSKQNPCFGKGTLNVFIARDILHVFSWGIGQGFCNPGRGSMNSYLVWKILVVRVEFPFSSCQSLQSDLGWLQSLGCSFNQLKQEFFSLCVVLST